MPKAKKKKVQSNVKKKIIEKKGIFDFDEPVDAPKKVTKTVTKKTKNKEEDHFIGTKEPEPINKKKIEKIKKEKIKEKKTKEKELNRIEKEQEKTRRSRAKRSRRARKTEEQIRRNLKIKLIMKVIALLAVIIGLLIFLMLSPVFNIKNILVEKNEQISSEQIISLSNVQKDMNMFKISSRETINAIKENPYVKKVEIKRKLPDTIKFIITERTASFMLEHGSSFVYIDSQGYILEISATPKDGLPKIRGYETNEENILPGNRLHDNDLNKLSTVIKIMSSAKNSGIDNIITTINIENENNYSLYLESENKTVYLGNCTSLDTRMLYVKVILEKEKEHTGEIFVDMDLNEKNPFFREKV